MKKHSIHLLILLSLTLSSVPNMAFSASRVDSLIQQDTTERLEDISELKHSIRSLKVQIRTLELALVEAKKKRSGKKNFVKAKKCADAVTAISTLGGALAATFFDDKIKVIKVTSLLFGISSSFSVILDLLAEMTTDEAENVQTKIDDIKPILKATEANLVLEVKLLCKNEPSNQMCN